MTSVLKGPILPLVGLDRLFRFHAGDPDGYFVAQGLQGI